MKTLLLRLSEDFDGSIARAAELIRAGEVVGMPTETVYGLAADALDPEAVAKIFAAKGRPQDNPLIVHISSPDEIVPLVTEFPERADRLAREFWPGPLTMILPKSGIVPKETSGGLGTVAVRCPSHPAARALIKASGVPLAAPSANISGRPSPTSFERVVEDMDGRVACILDGGDCSVGVESTVVTLVPEIPRLLRPGGVTLAMLQSVLGEVEVDPAVLSPLAEGADAASPGMKYRHYAPACEVSVVTGDAGRFRDVVAENAGPGDHVLCFDGEEELFALPAVTYGAEDDPAEQGRRLFDALRRLDDIGAKRAFARAPSEDGFGLAVCNRLYRAAGFRFL